jgi:hypothetical protein
MTPGQRVRTLRGDREGKVVLVVSPERVVVQWQTLHGRRAPRFRTFLHPDLLVPVE